MGGRGRGGGWGGGRGGGRGGFAALPMGLTHADLQSLSREGTAMYPPMIPPVLTQLTEDEKRIAAYQVGFAQRMRKSAYYVVENTKSTELPRYTDKYRPSAASQPTLKKKDLFAPYFPPEIFEGYFNPKKKPRKAGEAKKPASAKKRMNLDEMEDEDEEKAPSDASDAGSQAPESDYDVDEEYDNDYAENYFDNGENDDNDDLGGGGGADEGGGGDYD